MPNTLRWSFCLGTGLLKVVSVPLLVVVGSQAAIAESCTLDAGASGPAIFSTSLACGVGATTAGSQSTVIGAFAGALSPIGSGTTAVGYAAGVSSSGNGNSAVGSVSLNPDPANGLEGTVGAGSVTIGDGNSAFGAGSGTYVEGDGNAAYGANAGRYVTGSSNTAIGEGAGSGTFNNRLTVNNTTSIGAGAQAVRDNQMAFGTAANTYTMTGITSAASAAAQVGPTYLTTTDAGGNLAATTFTTQELVATLDQSTATNIAQDQSIADLDGRVGALENGNAGLANQIAETRTEARQGIAAAIAMANPAMPSAPGKTSWATNVGYFKGAVAFGGALTYRFDTPAPTALSLGYSYGGGDSHAARVGLQGEF